MTTTEQRPALTDADLERLIIQRALRVPRRAAGSDPSRTGAGITRQLDTALLSVGFKLSAELFNHFSECSEDVVLDAALVVLPAVRDVVGDHVQHNTYFRDFPANVPNTADFWTSCIAQALDDPRSAELIQLQLWAGSVNLLDLPTYGTYQHSYTEMLSAHETMIPSLSDRLTVLHLGESLTDETRLLYLRLVGSTKPLSATDRELLGNLAELLAGDAPHLEAVPIRENLAIINAVRLTRGLDLSVDTVTDVLRAAVAASGGDSTLAVPTRFRSFRRAERRQLLKALDGVVTVNPARLGDVGLYAEQWKRLGERLHPHEHPHHAARRVFAVARDEETARSLTSRVEEAFDTGDRVRATALLRRAPGMLLRNVDRLLRAGDPVDSAALDGVVSAVRETIERASGRVICSLIEHLQNRLTPAPLRVFANRNARAWITEDHRPVIDTGPLERVREALEAELVRRLPEHACLVVDPSVLGLALPLSEKSKPDGFGIMPRGSITPIDAATLRFFVHWREQARRTDFDLSGVMLDDDFTVQNWLSYTNLTSVGGVHSGDITAAPSGASEFIDIDLRQVQARYVVPQVNIYSGERFTEVAESFFGFMTRDIPLHGQPFEARTVRMKSDLRGSGRVALPMVFMRGADGNWSAKWMHLHLSGNPRFNRVEENHRSTSAIVRGVVERRYLTVGYLVNLLRGKAGSVIDYTPGVALPDRSVTFIGIERPEGLPAGSEVYTLDRFSELVPA